MLKAANLGGLIPPILHTDSRDSQGPRVRPDRPTTLLFAGAVASFGLALMLVGAAACVAAGAPTPADLDQSVLVFGSLAAAFVLATLGMVLALRERSLRTQQMRRTTRAEQIQGELDSLGLTPKEMPIAKLILQHQSYAAIAAERHLAVRTVQFHATNIFRKAYVSNRRDFEHVILADERDGCADREGASRESPCGGAGEREVRDGCPAPRLCRALGRSDAPAPGGADVAESVAPDDAAGGEREHPEPDPTSYCPTALRSRVALRQSR